MVPDLSTAHHAGTTIRTGPLMFLVINSCDSRPSTVHSYSRGFDKKPESSDPSVFSGGGKDSNQGPQRKR